MVKIYILDHEIFDIYQDRKMLKIHQYWYQIFCHH
jgi:hypothetical protein